MTDTPEIDRLREQSWQGDGLPRHDTVFLLDAIQAVRDTEARVRGERVGASGGRACPECGVTRWEAKQADGWIAEASAAARREAFREAVEALREQAREIPDDISRSAAVMVAADRLESRFLSHPDNPEGNA